MLAVVAGSKVSTKLEVLESLLGKCRRRSSSAAASPTRSLRRKVTASASRWYEADLLDAAQQIIAERRTRCRDSDAGRCRDGAERSTVDAPATVRHVDEVGADEMILDIGPETARALCEADREGAAPSSGTARSACSSSISSAKARASLARSDRGVRGVFDRGRRRYAGGDRQVRRRRRNLVHLHRRRRVSGIRGRKSSCRRSKYSETRARSQLIDSSCR